MTTLRIPDLVSAVHKLQRGIYPEYEEALQASEEWLARSANLPLSYLPVLNSKIDQK